jgi:hypothetical protein
MHPTEKMLIAAISTAILYTCQSVFHLRTLCISADVRLSALESAVELTWLSVPFDAVVDFMSSELMYVHGFHLVDSLGTMQSKFVGMYI